MQSVRIHMLRANLERRALQIVVAICALVPIVAGLIGALAGLDQAAQIIPTSSLDSHFRYLSGLLLAIGLGYWTTIPEIERKCGRFRMLTVIVLAGGLVRLASTVGGEHQPVSVLLALSMELFVTPLLAVWQARIAYGRQTGLIVRQGAAASHHS